MTNAVLALSAEALASAYPEPVLRRLRPFVGRLDLIVPAARWAEQPEVLAQAEVIFSGWGAPRMDEDFLRAAPQLRAVFYAGGSVRYFVTDAFWQRGIRVTTAQAINAIPVAEFALSTIQLGLKRFWHYARTTRERRSFPAERPMPGAFGAVVGLVSYGIIARLVREKLRSLDCSVVVYDPFLSDEAAAREGVRDRKSTRLNSSH